MRSIAAASAPCGARDAPMPSKASIARSGAASRCRQRRRTIDRDAGGAARASARPRRPAPGAGRRRARPTVLPQPRSRAPPRGRRRRCCPGRRGPGRGARAARSRARAARPRRRRAAISACGGSAASAAGLDRARRRATSYSGRRRPMRRIDVARSSLTSAQALDAEAVDVDRGGAPAIASATRRADPQDSAQPLAPWPRFSQTPSVPLGAEHRRPVGQHRPRAFPALRRRCARRRRGTSRRAPCRASPGALALPVGAAADLGAAGDADAVAQAADRDLVALVHQRRRAARGAGGRRRGAAAPSPSSHRPAQRQVQAERAQQAARPSAAQTTIASKLGSVVSPGSGCVDGGSSLSARVRRASSRAIVRRRSTRRRGSAPAAIDSTLGVEAEARAGALGFLAQQLGELAAVADLVVLQVDAGMQRRQRIEPGLDRAAAGGIEHLGATPSSASALDAGLAPAPARARCAAARGSPGRARSRGAGAASAACSRSRLKWASRCMRARLAR